MTDFTSLLQPDRGQSAQTIHLVDKASLAGWLGGQPAGRRAMVEAARFEGSAGQVLVLSGDGGFDVVAGVRAAQALTPWCLAAAAERLPAGRYRLPEGTVAGQAVLGWMVAQHRFDRFKSAPSEPVGARVLLSAEPARIDEAVALAEATALVRDLVNTPAGDLGPAEFEDVVRGLAKTWDAAVTTTTGDALTEGYPMIAAVGRAAGRGRGPRLVELNWGNPAHPKLALVGKGVVFDSGGLDIKPGSGMRLMKKDMGGAAHALALAGLIVALRVPVKLHLLIPLAENAIAGDAFRPGDVLVSRAGTTVEIDNTDAEGRLVLADAFTRAGEEDPRWMIDFATLTGAARVALGPDLPALFADDEELAAAMLAGGAASGDPLWRMPLWDGYDDMLKSDIADLRNSADSPFAGSVTAALFLRRFVPEKTAWAHLDTFAWRPSGKPGQPKGGEALGLRASLAAIRALVGISG